tara:strand:- start:104 stop:277 length:174 start_codon:yes stop_codon:yes gene_type:complete
MSTFTATYCAFCEAMSNFGRAFLRSCDAIAKARAANELTRMGLHKEAKALMTSNEEK